MICFRYIITISYFIFYSCSNESVKPNTSFTTNSSTNIVEEKQKPSNNKNTDQELKEVMTIAVKTGRNIIKTIKKNDSISAANREKIYVYQIGLPIADLNEVFEVFNKLENTESFYVLKKNKKEYYIVYMIDRNQQELNDSLQSFKANLPAGISAKIKVTNLMTLCPKKEKLMLAEKITKRKQDLELPCLICDK